MVNIMDNEDFKQFLNALAAMNKQREKDDNEKVFMGHKILAKTYMEMFMAFQEVGFTRDEAFDLLEFSIKNILGKRL